MKQTIPKLRYVTGFAKKSNGHCILTNASPIVIAPSLV